MVVVAYSSIPLDGLFIIPRNNDAITDVSHSTPALNNNVDKRTVPTFELLFPFHIPVLPSALLTSIVFGPFLN